LPLINELQRRNVIRVGIAYVALAWLLFQVAESILPIYGFGADTLRTILMVLVIGILPVLAFSWIYELTPQGIKKESEIDRSATITPRTGKQLDRMIMIFLALALTYFAFDKFLIDPKRDAERIDKARETAVEQAFADIEAALPERSIVVLPFADLSEDGSQEFFSDGIAEELLNLLAQIPELRVISRTSAFSFKGSQESASEIARQLRVVHILEGSVRESGGQVRITVQLIDARTDTHLWSQTFDRAMERIFAIQDDIAAHVVEKLKITLLGDLPNARVTDPTAFALFLRALYLDNNFSRENLVRAQKHYEQALTIDPHYAAAWSGLARNQFNQGGTGLMAAADAYERGREFALKALESQPDYAPTHARLGWMELHYNNDLQQAAKHVAAALELGPSHPVVLSVAAMLASYLGRQDESIVLKKLVADRDPVNPISQYGLAETYRNFGRTNEALEGFQKVQMLNPAYVGIDFRIGLTWFLEGNMERALSSMEAESSEPHQLIGLSIVRSALGREDDAQDALNQLIEKYEQVASYNIAYIYALRGEHDKSFAWLEKAVERKDRGLNQVVYDPLFSNLHQDPRWQPFLTSIGRSHTQLAAIELDLQLPD
jgi:TolB-like protein/Flp pilus assembly protein TadD